MIRNELIDALIMKTHVEVIPFKIDEDEFERFVRQWNYSRYYSKNMPEKALEHFVSLKLLDMGKDDIFMDIASMSSPFPKIVDDHIGCEVYRQDLSYNQGIHDRTVGGDAGALPFPDCSLTKMTLHCSFEHFERDADTRFIREADRVLKPGGKVCILPLYLKKNYMNFTDPRVDQTGLVYDEGAEIRENIGLNNRFARHYNPEKLKERVFDHCVVLKPTIYFVENEKEADETCYLKFVLMLEKD